MSLSYTCHMIRFSAQLNYSEIVAHILDDLEIAHGPVQIRRVVRVVEVSRNCLVEIAPIDARINIQNV